MTKKALITGSSKGLGKAICQKFLREDIEVIGISRSQADTEWPSVECDLTNSKELESTINEIFKEHGTPNILVNNAGVYYAHNWEEQSLDEFETTLSLNATAPFLLTKVFAKKLIEENKPGAIVNMGSVSGHIGSVDIAYGASKAALEGITKSYARALAPHNIRVNAVAPGPCNTEMSKNHPEEVRKRYQASILQKRYGEPEEIADAVYFLVTDNSSLMTGEIMNANGGIL